MTNPDDPCVTEWTTRNGVHRRSVGPFMLIVEAGDRGWSWSVERDRSVVAEGVTPTLGQHPASLARAKAACEAAARRAGIAVPR